MPAPVIIRGSCIRSDMEQSFPICREHDRIAFVSTTHHNPGLRSESVCARPNLDLASNSGLVFASLVQTTICKQRLGVYHFFLYALIASRYNEYEFDGVPSAFRSSEKVSQS